MAISTEDRTLAIAYLNSRFSTLVSEVGQSSIIDIAAGWSPDLDNATLRMGGGGARIAFYALSEYYALERFATLLTTRVDTEGYAIEGDRETVFDNVIKLLRKQAAVVANYGYPVDMTYVDNNDIGLSSPFGGDVVGVPPLLPETQQAGTFSRDWYDINDVADIIR